jgi:hypothetical protein
VARRIVAACLLLAALIVAAIVLLLREGAIPVSWSPLPALNLAEPDNWLLDWRLAEVGRDAQLCARVLTPPWIEATAVADVARKDGCGWSNGVRMRAAGGARLHADPITCELAAGLALWLAHEVQPRAQAMLGAKVTAIQHFGGYSCRNIKGNPIWADVRSQHARANALDIAAFTLAGGRQVSVARHWTGDSPEGRFLHAIHASACRYFRVAVGPDYNILHRNHFHYDRGRYRACR